MRFHADAYNTCVRLYECACMRAIVCANVRKKVSLVVLHASQRHRNTVGCGESATALLCPQVIVDSAVSFSYEIHPQFELLLTATDGGGQAVTATGGGGQAVMATDGGGQAVTATDGGGQAVMATDGGGQAVTVTGDRGQAVTATDGGGQAVTVTDDGG